MYKGGWRTGGRSVKKQENGFHMNLPFLLWVPSAIFSPDVFLYFSLCLTSPSLLLAPSPACFSNSLFICCLQRVALSLEDDGYPWGGRGSSLPPPPHSYPGPSATSLLRGQYNAEEKEKDSSFCIPFWGAGMTYTSCKSSFLSYFLHWSNITTTTSHYYFP